MILQIFIKDHIDGNLSSTSVVLLDVTDIKVMIHALP